ENGVYEMKSSNSEVPSTPVINKIPYGLDINPENGNIYCLTADFETKGFVYRYDSEYQLKDSVRVGYNPNAVVFE
ncbi:MAG: hypothetical protein K9H65_04280, partial [Bacteroidales bacterium]|nr:hypothetical protein [Bacteroidales bacterium]